jgi:serpin B
MFRIALIVCLACLNLFAQDAAGVSKEDLAAQVRKTNDFAFKLYGELAKESGNVAFSPHSLSVAFAMTWAACLGDTHREIGQTLGLGPDQELTHRVMAALSAALQQRADGSDFGLRLANRLWGYSRVPHSYYEKPLLDFLGQTYRSPFGQVDFGDEPKARSEINDWVSSHTDERISELIPSGILNALVRMVLVNAIHFQDSWETAFNREETRRHAFRVDPGKDIKVDMMSRTGSHPVVETPDLTLVEMPYSGKSMRMLAILPAKAVTMEALAGKLSAALVESLRGKLRPEKRRLLFPRFHLETSYDLAKVGLPALGMKAPFKFSEEWKPLNGGRDKLAITNVIHSVVIDVDEKGTEAAAATAIVLKKRGGPRPLRFNRPFLFLIQPCQSGLILFLGRVVHPMPIKM